MNRKTIALSFVAACAVCALVLGALATLVPRPTALVLWLVTLLLTYLVSAYQRRTGPGYAIPASCMLGDTHVTTRLPTSFSGDGDCPVTLTPLLDGPAPRLIYRRYPTNDAWQDVAFAPSEDRMVALVPHQPPAGKVEYHIELADTGDRCTLPRSDNVIVRFRGSVSAAVLLPHVLLMLAGMVLSIRAGLEAWYDGPLQVPFTWMTLVTLVAGSMVFGPLVQKAAFGKYWTGVPLGHDLTDNKMLVAVLAWASALTASIAGWESAPVIRLAASGISLVAFLIPHSLFGSELRYDE